MKMKNTITVTDTGKGISASQIDKLFRIDESYSAKETQNEDGAGLGLVLCKEFIDKHEDEISVKSKENEGSAFSVKLPKINVA